MSYKSAEAPKRTIFLHDYQPPAFTVDGVEMTFDLEMDQTRVETTASYVRTPSGGALPPGSQSKKRGTEEAPDLVLDGEALRLVSVAIDGKKLGSEDYALTTETLTIRHTPESFTLTIVTEISPKENTSLSGLYKSGDALTTQCEAHGFRRITYFLDRPDVMARYKVTLRANASQYPTLLANGNLVRADVLPDGRHSATWQDPFPKPSYLFALVAGNFHVVEDSFTTASNHKVLLQVFAQGEDIRRCDHAMYAVKAAMRWDEENYGREYDLDRFMIVAIQDFNAGAMENKGLNIFNARYLLADPDTATDADYEAITAVIGHEYFHNWTGNRITCRDWFQLSLKEGLTVFREQQFSEDMTSRAVKRIRDVNLLRSRQFPEDAGPMSHPVKPKSYIEVDNFYTLTVYEKGAEVIRMLRTLLGAKAFRRGMDLYFERHDGQAATTEDFVQAMADASGVDLTQFRHWYDQEGTPRIKVETNHDVHAGTWSITLRQSVGRRDPRQQQALQMPITLGLLDSEGKSIPIELGPNDGEVVGGTAVLNLRDWAQTFMFSGIHKRPVPAVLRGFSAPVVIESDIRDADLYFLAAHEHDAFVRWEATQQIATKCITTLRQCLHSGRSMEVPKEFIDICRRTLVNEHLDLAFIAEVLTLPNELYLGTLMDVIDIEGIHVAREFLKREIGQQLTAECHARYVALSPIGAKGPTAEGIAARRLQNVCLDYLVAAGHNTDSGRLGRSLCLDQYHRAENMTMRLGAISALNDQDCQERHDLLENFYETWRHSPLIFDKWLSIQALSGLASTLDNITRLACLPEFDIRNPNRVYSLYGAFGSNNPARFHEPDGRGYDLITEVVCELDALNPMAAARICQCLAPWRRFDRNRQHRMRTALEHIASVESISKGLYEVVSKSLGDSRRG